MPICDKIYCVYAYKRKREKHEQKTVALIALTALMLLVCTVCFAVPPSNDYQLILADEFNGTELDSNIWSYRGGNPYGGKNLPENVRVQDGMLHLDYRKIDGIYTGGGVLTPFTLPYGYYEVEAKVYNGANGLHTSFWTLGANSANVRPKYFPNDNCFMEIDIFEIDSREDDQIPNIHHGLHNWCGVHTSPFGGGKCTVVNSSEEFFVMGMEWLPDTLNYYINGELVSSYDGVSIYGPSYLWLTAVAMPEKYAKDDGTFDIDDSKMDENGYFGSSLFKYFRYYQRPLKNVNLLGNGNFEYNKVTNSIYPSAFYLEGTKNASYIQKTPLAYDGMCYHTHQSTTPYSLATGQQFYALVPGKYTFKGQFKATSGLTTARLVVYDKDKNVIAEKNIPQSDEWTEVCMSDIEVDGEVFVVVESSSNGGTMLSIDALEFFIQDGEEYTSSNTPLYETSLGVETIPYTTYTLNDAVSSTGTWTSSGLEEDTFWLSGTSKYGEVVWEIPIPEDDNYRLELRNIIDSSNAPSQDYYITLPDGTEQSVTVDTKNGETSWLSLGSYNLKIGDTLKVTMKATKKNGNIRVTKLKLSKDSDFLAFNSVALKLGEFIFSHKNTPYIFDKQNRSLVPYEENGVYYIPYQKLKEISGIVADIDENSVYITDTQIKALGLDLSFSDDVIFIHEKSTNFDEAAKEKSFDMYISFIKPYFPVFAKYISAEDLSGQLAKDHTIATLTGTAWTKSTHNTPHIYTGVYDSSAQWTFAVPYTGEYTIDIYSPSHSNSSSNTGVYIYANSERNVYALNQTETPGWYNVGTYNLEEASEVKVLMKHLSSSIMRVAKVRLAPTKPTKTATFVNDNDALNQEYYSHETATKNGSWQNSSGVYNGCCTAPPTEENKSASIVWNVTPKRNTRYSVQIYVPKYTSSGAYCAEAELTLNGNSTLFNLNQRADSEENHGAGWYELGEFDLTTSSDITISLKNKTMDGWLRAKAVRLVPVIETPVFASDKDSLFQEYYGKDHAVTTGTWINSSGTYKNCIAALYSKTNKDASVNWTVNPKTSATYDIQVFIPKYTTDATKNASIDLEISGKTMHFEISEQADSEQNHGAGWYSLGSYLINFSDDVSVTLTNKGEQGWLRAKAIRLVSNKNIEYVGNYTSGGQELHTYNDATKTGTWKSSSAVLGQTTYYGADDSTGNATITWNVTPKTAQKYSIQIFMPHHTSGSTTAAYVTLTIDGLSHTFSGINQNSDPADGTGWYDLGVFDLTTASQITLTLGKKAGSFLRARDVRLVPLSEVSVTKTGASVTIEAGAAVNAAKAILFAEYDGDSLKSVQVLTPSHTMNVTMSNSNNKYKIFFWNSIEQMIPVIPAIETN